jgi:hypothetical protein
MVETAQAWGVRNAVTGALLMMEAAGSTTARDGFGDFLHLGPDFAGLQTTDDTDKTSPVTTPGSTVMVLQLDKKNKQVRAEVTGKAIMLLGEQGSVVGTTGALQVSTQGATASEHVATTEQVLNILNNFLLLLSGFSAPGALAALSAPPARDAFLASVLSAAGVPGTGTVSPAVMSALAGAMAGKLPNPTGNNPGVTCPGFLAG